MSVRGRDATTAVVALAALSLAGCSGSDSGLSGSSGSSVAVSQSTWTRGEWPFTVSHGVLGCTDPQQVTFNVDGTAYAVNGSAMDAGFRDIKPIWKPAPGGLRVDIGPMIDKGLTLCTK